MRAAIYLRVSSPEQAEEDRYSLPTQERACLAVASAGGDEVVAAYVDAGATAYRDEIEHRPQFQRMLQDAAQGKFGRLYVYALDRFSRASMAASGEWLRQLGQAGVELVSALEWFDDSPSGELLRTILLGQSRYFSRLHGQKVSDALRQKQRGGEWVGVRPYGYAEAGPMTADEIQASGYRLAVRLVLEGEESLSAICRMLNAAGFRTGRGGPWHHKALAHMLRSPAYLGIITLPDGTQLPGAHDPLLDRAEWEMLQSRLRQFARPQHGRRPRVAFPLSGILHCDRCGAHMVGASPGAERRPCYWCSRHKKSQDCPAGQRYFYAEPCEELVGEILDSIHLGAGWQEAVERELQVAEPRGPSLSEIKRQERALMDMYQWGAFEGDAAEFKRRWGELQSLREVRQAPHKRAVLEMGELLAAGLGELWRRAHDKEKRQLARLLFRAVYIDGPNMNTVELKRPVDWQPAVIPLLRLLD